MTGKSFAKTFLKSIKTRQYSYRPPRSAVRMRFHSQLLYSLTEMVEMMEPLTCWYYVENTRLLLSTHYITSEAENSSIFQL